MFWAQIVASSVALTTQLGVQASMFTNIHAMCGCDGDNGFICLSTTVFGTASIIWGVISRTSLFLLHSLRPRAHSSRPLQPRQRVPPRQDVLPSPVLLPHRRLGTRNPRGSLLAATTTKFFKYINLPVIFTGTGNIPPATAVNYIPAVIVCFIFN